ncbi:MAG: formylglycine-generating enzyme family protein [Armatimonadota bacterium]
MLSFRLFYLSVMVTALAAGYSPAHAATVITGTNPRDGAVMVWIPAGEFLMGTPLKARDEWNKNECPQHRVTLDGYWIYQREVSVAQYRAFCEATGRRMPAEPEGGWQNDYPVTNVNWFDAQAYAAWAGAKLPTEARWEKAARGGDGRIWPWGNKIERSPYDLYSPELHACGSIPDEASPYGMMDSVGNAWEWCADWYAPEYYRQSPNTNPQGPAKGAARVLRGGFAIGFAGPNATIDLGSVGCAVRNSDKPTATGSENALFGRLGYGFRCVMLPGTPDCPAPPSTQSSK